MTTPRDLVLMWRERADRLREWDAGGKAAGIWSKAADELAVSLRDTDDELLTLSLASRESGFMADHLGRLIRMGKLANAGRAGAPRIRRSDLPHRPGRPTSGTLAQVRADLAAGVIHSTEG